MAIQLRRDTAANWALNNPTPVDGQPCYETDTYVLKIGDGVTPYNSLSPISGGGGGSFSGVSAGTTKLTAGTAVFSDASGVSFGIAGSTITASVRTDYQSSGAYLTTAMQSQLTSAFRYTSDDGQLQFTSNNSNFQSAGAYLTAFHISGGGSTADVTNADFGDGFGVSWFVDGNKISASVETNYQSAGAYLTTAMQSSAATISNVKMSAGTLSTNRSDFTFGNSNGVSFGLNTNGVFTGSVQTNYQSAGAYLTTAMQSNAATISNINFSAGTTSQNLSKLTFADSNGISFGLNGSVVTGTVATNYQSQGAYLTTAMQSNAATISNVNLSAGTTSNNLSKFVFADAGGVSFGLNGSTVTASAPAAAPSPVNFSAGGASGNLGSVVFSNSNGVSFGLNGSTITASAAAGGGGIALANSQTTYTSGTAQMVDGFGAITIASTTGQKFNFSVPATSSLSATGQVSISANGSTISIGVPNALTLSYFNPQDAYVQVAGQLGQSTLMFQPMQAPNVQFDRIAIPMIYSNASNSSFSVSVTQSIGIYTRNASSLSLLFSTYFNTNMSGSGTVGGNYSSHGGLRLATIPITSTLTEGQYWVGMVSQTTTGGGAGMTISNVLASQMNSSFSGIMGQQTASSIQYTRGLGKYSAATTAFPASVAFSEIYGMSSAFLRQPLFYFVSGTF